jgi:catechol 2,3-dioxygenase-like lactoylglutathione lyase family enzyme
MALVEPGLFHRLGLVVNDVAAAAAWYKRILGCSAVAGNTRPHQDTPEPDVLERDGANAEMLWHGGLPMILLGAATPDGPVGRFMGRWGAGLHSLAWEIEDMWTLDHLLRQRGIRITGANLPGRHFFMHPADFDGLLLEWTDTSIVGDPRRGETPPPEGLGVVGGVEEIAWVLSVVADADATADRLREVAAAVDVANLPSSDAPAERTIDLQVGDIVMRLVTPRTETSRYWEVLQRGPRLWSYAVRVPDLDAALDGLQGAGVKMTAREGSRAWTDPATTVGVPIEWTVA